MLHLYSSNRMESLVGELAGQVLKAPLSSPFASEQIVVETQGLGQWLKLELARRAGIVANIDFPFPRAFITWLIRQCVTLGANERLIEPEALAWRIMGMLPAAAQKSAEACPEIHNYLSAAAGTADLRRNFQLADRVASLFDQYSVFRPQIIEAWIAGTVAKGAVDSIWQRRLWRDTMTDGLACQGKFLFDLIQALERPDCPVTQSLERLTVFCPRSLPPIYLEVFKKLSDRVPVHLFCLCPSEYYWGDIVTPREKEAIFSRAQKQGIPIDDQKLLLDKIHPLLSAWGKTGRNFQRLIVDVQQNSANESSLFAPPEGATLLSRIQSSIYELDDLSGEPEGAEIDSSDRSIQIHSCHSQLRELQVLRDEILSWLDEDETLSPQDILVMVPDNEAYAPFIKGVFGDMEQGSPAIPFTFADRGARQESPVVDAFISFLQMPSGRFSATEVIDFFEIPAVHRRFNVAEAELPQIRLWIQSAAIRWGRDAAHRERLGLPQYAEHSWAHGCDRLILGYAMADTDDQLISNLLPCPGIEGTPADLLGRWLEFVRTFFSSVENLAQNRPLKDWAQVLNDLLDALFSPGKNEEQALQFIRSQTDALRQQQEGSGYDHDLPLEVVRERIIPKLQEPQPGKALLRGALTFSGLAPLRGIPFKAICLLGLQDDAFPRNPVPPSFDLIAKKREDGDESCREDDRFLFLESLLAARNRFYVSYVGQSIKDNSVRPPSVVVCELQDFIARRFRLKGKQIGETSLNAWLVTHHRLQAFSSAYFRPAGNSQSRLFSYSPAMAEISELVENPGQREKPSPFYTPTAGEKFVLPEAIPLGDLQKFFLNPSKYFLGNRLNLKLPQDKEAAIDEEPFALNSLEEYNRRDELLTAHFAGKEVNFLNHWQGLGVLPHGVPGACIAADLHDETQKVINRVLDVVGQVQPVAKPVRITIGGHVLEGQIAHYPGLGIVHYRAGDVDRAKKAKYHLRLWLEHLALQVTELEGKDSWLIGKDGIWRYRAAGKADAEKILSDLIGLYQDGLTAPLPFFPNTSFAYALEPDGQQKMDKASKAWEGDDYTQEGEQSNPDFNLCFRNQDDLFGDTFKAVAELIALPIAGHSEKESAK